MFKILAIITSVLGMVVMNGAVAQTWTGTHPRIKSESDKA